MLIGPKTARCRRRIPAPRPATGAQSASGATVAPVLCEIYGSDPLRHPRPFLLRANARSRDDRGNPKSNPSRSWKRAGRRRSTRTSDRSVFSTCSDGPGFLLFLERDKYLADTTQCRRSLEIGQAFCNFAVPRRLGNRSTLSPKGLASILLIFSETANAKFESLNRDIYIRGTEPLHGHGGAKRS
jgi:hypothetical protein